MFCFSRGTLRIDNMKENKWNPEIRKHHNFNTTSTPRNKHAKSVQFPKSRSHISRILLFCPWTHSKCPRGLSNTQNTTWPNSRSAIFGAWGRTPGKHHRFVADAAPRVQVAGNTNIMTRTKFPRKFPWNWPKTRSFSDFFERFVMPWKTGRSVGFSSHGKLDAEEEGRCLISQVVGDRKYQISYYR